MNLFLLPIIIFPKNIFFITRKLGAYPKYIEDILKDLTVAKKKSYYEVKNKISNL